MGSCAHHCPPRREHNRDRTLAFTAACYAMGMAMMLATETRAQHQPHGSLLPLIQKYCVDCHAGEDAKAKIDLEKMSADPSFETGFQEWRRAARAVDDRKMPPPMQPQPIVEERRQIATSIRTGLSDMARKHANDPGETVIRRLSAAEYAYTMKDLTGVDFDLDKDFVSDAVGGEGFTNVGNVQFMQDSTLERYLDAAKTIASYAVIGAGKLYFYRDAGLQGREFSAVERIQQIYQRHGFRARGGELTPPFGMDCYPKALYAAWRYRYRQELGIGDATLAQLAAEEKVQLRFLEHIWSVVNDQTLIHPTKEIVNRWRALPGPMGKSPSEIELTTRQGIGEVIKYLQTWYELLSTNSVERETGTVFANERLEIEASQPYVARFSSGRRGSSDRTVEFLLTVLPVSNSNENAVVIWRRPIIYFETLEGDEPAPLTLKQHLSDDSRELLKFGQNPGGSEIGPDDFVMKVGETRTFTVTQTQQNSGTMDLIVETVLDPILGKDCVVRCDISSARVPDRQRMYSALLGDKNWIGLPRFREEVTRFAEAFPEISHREPARADRDPIPLMYGGSIWNNPDRNFFHSSLKYYRGDRFLVEKILDGPTKRELDDAWTDLLTSFDHHDLHLRFAAKKFHVDLQGKTIANVLPEQIEKLPTGELHEVVKEVRNRPVSERLRDIELGDVRGFVREQVAEYQAMQARLRAARSRHVADVLDFASRAWRRPLTADEHGRLRAFYADQLKASPDDHSRAIRGMLTRVLVSPEFLYRGEGPLQSLGAVTGEGQVRSRSVPNHLPNSVRPLTDHELATRLSYFLWSSVPDDELRQAADAGTLHDPATIELQTRRMLRDPKIRRFATEFFGQWLGFYQFERFRGFDSNRFPEFTEQLKQSFYDEARGFFEHIVREDRPIGEILFADYTFLNNSLAQHYGISAGLTDGAPRKVATAADSHRGGLFGLAAVLATTSNPLRTSPVRRGDWILRRVLGSPVPPPPADAGSIPADDVLGDGLTVRERLDAHRRNASCAGCHTRIDPLGFTLENYDTLGRWRTHYRDGRPIDSTGVLTDGTTVAGLDGLRSYLKAQEGQFQRNLCVKLVGYAFGRSESLADAHLIDEMTSKLATDSRFSGMVMSIVVSPQFRLCRDITLAGGGND